MPFRSSSAFFALSLALGLFAGPARAADPHPLAPIDAIDVQDYGFVIDGERGVSGDRLPISERVRLRVRRATDRLAFHYDATKIELGGVRVLDDSGARFRTVTLPKAGKAARTLLEIRLSRRLPAGAAAVIDLAFTVAFRRKVDQNDGGVVKTRLADGGALINAHSWPYFARNWAILNDHPADVARVEFEIALPPGYSALANGEPLARASRDGKRVSAWRMETPIQTYAFTFMIGRFESAAAKPADGIRPTLYWDPGYATDASSFRAELPRIRDALALFARIFRGYPYGKLAFGVVPHPFNMESTTMISAVDAESMVHELVHQWWGNAVRMLDWNELWISEGFTTYLTGYFDEVTRGKNTACRQESGTLRPTRLPIDALAIFDNTPYCKGAAAVDALRAGIADLARLRRGDALERKLFEGVLADLYQRFKFRNIASEDLVRGLRADLRERLSTVGGSATPAEIETMLERWWTRWIRN